MSKSDLPDVLVLGQRDPEIREMGRDAEEFLRSLLSEPPHYGQVYVRDGLIDAFSIIRIDKKRFTYLTFVFRNPEAGIALLEHRLTRLTSKRRFAHLRIEISSETAAVLTWATKKGALVRSCGRDSGSVTVTFSRPRVMPREGHPSQGRGT